MVNMILANGMVKPCKYLYFDDSYHIFSHLGIKNYEKLFAIQKNYIILSSVIMAIVVCNSLYFNTIKIL